MEFFKSHIEQLEADYKRPKPADEPCSHRYTHSFYNSHTAKGYWTLCAHQWHSDVEAEIGRGPYLIVRVDIEKKSDGFNISVLLYEDGI
jgi:hypothetical protein